MTHRKDLNQLSTAQRTTLVNLMLNYLTEDVIADHMNIVHSGVQIFTGHRAYIAGMEGFLSANGGGAFVPLPVWDSKNPIPAEFNVIKNPGPMRPPLQNLNPGIPKPAQFEYPQVCENFDDPDDLGNAINPWHGQVHCAIGGTMCNIMQASAAPIFWCWHAFVDHVYWDWQHCAGTCPELVGSSLTLAKRKIKAAGFRLGAVTRLPKFLVQAERLPFGRPVPLPDPAPLFNRFEAENAAHDHVMTAAAGAHAHAGGGTAAATTGRPADLVTASGFSFFRNQRDSLEAMRGPFVVAQAPKGGTQVRAGVSVEVTVLTD